MRRLLYVPIIHMESDLGSAGSDVSSKSASLYGEKRWSKHKETVAQFWRNLDGYFASVDACNLKIYQDGLPTEGKLGRKVIEEAAKRGSKNHQIILNLIRDGAEIRKTEDVSLLEEEYKYVTGLAQSESAAEKTTASVNYKLRKNHLTKERDKFVAKTINETLKEGEVGLLFMGSYHDILPHLAKDIMVGQVKERQKINAYFKALISSRDEGKLKQLAEYLTSKPLPSGDTSSNSGDIGD